ncbi:hypothetical protein AMS68_008004 [Peltaster fructicola]|uniref:t-SNARE coiled-coil homology domain-containing protein n=1 Tax=Peltaster fructicola TaxID=286661 RepID=A0A6H0Y606_9PEZI|nr:hypothetical protein AMS68_008004 [Peltaster fructicola]
MKLYGLEVQGRPASTPGQRTSSRTAASQSGSPYSLGQFDNSSGNGGASFGAYPGSSDNPGGYRPATPNKKGQYSGAVLDELESQNDEQVGEMSKRVKMLKDITVAIGTEIRDSTAFAEKMNDQFEGTRNRLRGTMNRMLIMAERTGIGWRIWLGFFAFLILLFMYVWLF